MPLTVPLRHASADVAVLEEIYVRLASAEGVRGWGEVRGNAPYATGETGQSVLAALRAFGGEPQGSPSDQLPELVIELTGNRLAAALVEGAVLDARARAAGLTVAQYLGGSGRSRCVTHGQIGHVGPGLATSLAARMVAQGFRRIKVRVGCGDLDEDEARLAAVRQSAGSDTELAVDANGAWSAAEAFEAVERLARYRLEWLEQPTKGEDVTGLAEVAGSIGIPVFADEAVRTAEDVERLVARPAIAGVHLKLEKAGTVTELRKAVGLARDAGLRVMVGQVDQGRLGTSLTAQAADAVDADLVEASGFYYVGDDPTSGIELTMGEVRLSGGPGLGIEVDTSRLEEVVIPCATN